MKANLNQLPIGNSVLNSIGLNSQNDGGINQLIHEQQKFFCFHNKPIKTIYDAILAAALTIAEIPYQYHLKTGVKISSIDTYVSFKIYSPQQVVYLYLTDIRLVDQRKNNANNLGLKQMVVSHNQAAFLQDITGFPFQPVYNDMSPEYFYEYVETFIANLAPQAEIVDFSTCHKLAIDFLKRQKAEIKAA